MPKSTFFNLKKEKRARIIEAAGQEFSQQPLYNASINNIIKTAKIPRGSFYQYFEDLPDLYGYYFSLILENIQEDLIDSVYKDDGDIFKAVQEYASIYLEDILAGPHHNFYKNFFLGANIAIQSKKGGHGPGFDVYHSERLNQLRVRLKEVVNWEQLKVENEDDQNALQQLIMMIFFHSFANYFVHAIDSQKHPEDVLKEIKRNLSWLEFGVRRMEEQ